MNEKFSEEELLDFKTRAIQDGANSFFSYLSAHRDAQSIIEGEGFFFVKRKFVEAVDIEIMAVIGRERQKLEGQ